MAQENKKTDADLLDASFDGLAGKELIARLVQECRFGTLEAFWRHGNAEIAADVASGLARSGHPGLTRLLVADIVEPAKGDPVPTAVIEAIAQDEPAFNEADIVLLADHLEEETSLGHPTYEEQRAHLEIAVASPAGK